MTFIVPKELIDLPVLKTLPSIDVTKDFILSAHTGSGKTLVIAPYICDIRKRLCILRQPTRKMAQLIHRSLSEFFPSLTIGLITSEDRETEMRFLNSYNIVVISDGVLASIIKKLDMSRTVIIFDECHWMMGITESELALANMYKQSNPSLQIVLLSATINPFIFAQYFEKNIVPPINESKIRDVCAISNSEKVNALIQLQNLRIYYSEGTAFPIKKTIWRVVDINSIDDKLSEFCYTMKNDKTFGLIFLPTRAETMEAHRKYSYICPTMFYNADTPTEDLLNFFKLNPNGGNIFSTVALSTSATLPFSKTLIVDKGNDTEYSEIIEQRINKYGVHLDYNTILQMAGRVARLFPGEAILVTTRDISWSDIVPTSIIPPLKKELPISAALISAAHGIDISKAQLLSVLSPSQISKSLDKLKRYKFIDETGAITTLGKRALSLPLEPEDAKILLSTPSTFIPATAAYLSFPQGMFYLVDSSSPAKNRASLYSNYTFNSIPLTKISLLQDIILNKHNLKVWCHDNAINYKRATMAIFSFHQIGKKFSQSPSDFDEALLALDFSHDSPTTNSYRTLIYMLQPKFPAPLDGSGFGIHDGIKKHYSFFSDLEFFSVEYPQSVYKVSARFSLFQAKGKPDIYGRLSDATIPLSLGAGATV